MIGVGQLKFRGTSFLLRSPTSVVNYLREKNEQLVGPALPRDNSLSKKRRKNDAGDHVEDSNDVTDLNISGFTLPYCS